MQNHSRRFRPLRGGIEVWNPKLEEAGTLGFLATDAGGGPGLWLVSCYHVLVGGQDREPVNGEPIRQPCVDCVGVAAVDDSRADRHLDCAAARLLTGVEAVAEALGLGPIRVPAEPSVGMRVVKSGATTGVTEGIIDTVDGDRVIVGRITGFDSEYELCGPGDSGALWLERESRSPVAVHGRGSDCASGQMEGRSLSAVLEALRLRMLLHGE